MMATDTPRVWIGCLAAYNDGRLYGRWEDVPTDPDDLRETIAKVLKGSPVPNAEEYFFADNENIPGPMSREEWPNIENLCALVSNLEDAWNEDAFRAYMSGPAEEYGDPTGEDWSDHYEGEHDSEAEWAQSRAEDTGWIDDDNQLASYVDWSAVARDWMSDGYNFVRSGGTFHVFRDNA